MQSIALTARLVIREFLKHDQSEFIEINTDPIVSKYVPLRSNEESVKLFYITLAEYDNSFLGRWGIFHRTDNDFVGMCALRPSDYDNSKIELGYRLREKYWGGGIATELATAIVSYGLKRLP